MNWKMIAENFSRAWDEFVKEKYPNVDRHVKYVEPEMSKNDFLIKYDLNLLNLRDLYDYFDSKRIVVNPDYYFDDEYGNGFIYTIKHSFCKGDPPFVEDYDFNSLFKERREVDIAAFTKAFEIRNDQLLTLERQEVK